MNFVILKCPLKDNHGLRVSCPWLVSKAQAIDTIALDTILFSTTMFLFSIYEPPIILYSSYIKELILLPPAPSNTILDPASNTPRTLPRPSSCPRESLTLLAVDHGVFGSNWVRSAVFKIQDGVDWRRWRTGRRRTLTRNNFGDSLRHDFLFLEFILIYEQVQILKFFKGG